MVTARPVPDQTMLDEGTGVPDVRAAMRWLEGSHAARGGCSPGGPRVTAAFRPNGLETAGDTVQSFVLQRSAGGPESFSLRSNAGWLLAPNAVDMKESSARLDLRYRPEALKNPGVYTGVVSGWTSDTMAGLTVAAVAVPQAMAYAQIAGIPPQYGLYTAIVMTAVGALFDSSKQLINGPTNAISIAVLSALVTFGDAERLPAAIGDDAALYVVDGRDVVTGCTERSPSLRRFSPRRRSP
jgi:hypothetical protein